MGLGHRGPALLVPAVSVKIVVAFSYAALADVDEVFASAGGFNQTSPI